MLWGDDNVNTELAAAAITPTPAATEDVVPAALAVVDICWVVAEVVVVVVVVVVLGVEVGIVETDHALSV